MNPIQPRQWETTFKGEDFNRDKIINAESMHSDCLDTECCDNSMGEDGRYQVTHLGWELLLCWMQFPSRICKVRQYYCWKRTRRAYNSQIRTHSNYPVWCREREERKVIRRWKYDHSNIDEESIVSLTTSCLLKSCEFYDQCKHTTSLENIINTLPDLLRCCHDRMDLIGSPRYVFLCHWLTCN